jgi:hypothetical protein
MKIVDMSEDPSIATQDTVTKSLIETSYRFRIDAQVALTQDENPDVASIFTFAEDVEYASYYVGNAVFDGNSWTFSPQSPFVKIALKYVEAVDIAQKAVHKESDERTVKAERIVSKTDEEIVELSGENPARLVAEEISDNKIRIGFENSSGDVIGGFEATKVNGEWSPIIWMRPGTAEYPVSYMSPDGFSVFDNRGNYMDITQNRLRFGNFLAKFVLDPTELLYMISGKTGLWVKHAGSDWTGYTIQASEISSAGGGTAQAGYDSWKLTYSNGGPANVVAKFDLGADKTNYPTFGSVRINQRLLYETPHISNAIVSATVELSDDGSNWSFAFVDKWYLKGGQTIVEAPFEFSIRDNSGYMRRYIRITYSVTPTETLSDGQTVSCSVGFQTGAHLWYEFFGNTEPTVEVSNIVMNDHILWIDDSGRLRVKKVDDTKPSTLGKALDDMYSAEPTDDSSSIGGKEVGGFDLKDVEIAVDSNTSATSPVYDSSQKKLIFPVASASKPSAYGLLPGSKLAEIESQLSKLASPDETPLTLLDPNNVAYVSASGWTVPPGDNDMYFNSISDALNAINNKGWTSAVIVLYPGSYSGFDMAATNLTSLAITALGAGENITNINGTIFVGSSTKEQFLYLACSVIGSGNTSFKLSSPTDGSSRIIVAPGYSISSTSPTIGEISGAFYCYSPVWHDKTSTSSGDYSFKIGVNQTEYTIAHFYDKVEIKDSEYDGFNVIRGILRFDNQLYMSSPNTSTANYAVRINQSSDYDVRVDFNGPIELEQCGLLTVDSSSSDSRQPVVYLRNDVRAVNSAAVVVNVDRKCVFRMRNATLVCKNSGGASNSVVDVASGCVFTAMNSTIFMEKMNDNASVITSAGGVELYGVSIAGNEAEGQNIATCSDIAATSGSVVAILYGTNLPSSYGDVNNS